jgi:hypothetical protein
VVVLRVVGEDLGFLGVVEGLDELIDAAAKLFTPFLAIDEPMIEGIGCQSCEEARNNMTPRMR